MRGLIVDVRGSLFHDEDERGLDSVWGTEHLKRSEIFSYQMKQVLAEDLVAMQWIRHISGQYIDMTTTFRAQIKGTFPQSWCLTP